MKIVFYSQHVLGVGHLFRSLEIVRALRGHEVVFVTGGAEVDLDLPDHATRYRLPGLMMDEEFSRFIPVEPGADVDEVLARRKGLFLELMERERPDIFLVELFPFGRNKFKFELLPILENVRAGKYGACKSVCSLRDILVEKPNQARFETRVLGTLNPLFHALLVHADPGLVRLEETFPAAGDITIPVHYTGYVAPRSDPEQGRALARELGLGDAPLVVASAGGGSVGQELLHATLEASRRIGREYPHRLCLFTGPYAPETDYAALRAKAEGMDRAMVERFTDRFPAYIAAAALSVSLAGYNTTMNLLAASTFGLVMPFDQNREQRMRAERLEKMGLLTVLDPGNLNPDVVAQKMIAGLGRGPTGKSIDLDGAANTARLLRTIIS
ncbi:glycosyltransferase family protein [Salidesulfovibrio onnuriiensis]|uniref:glycosyltransferase family protein n=1 Tax=Salidesulfovibrio onnuriiensis TaxID=2583823 RepID=UPI0011CC06DC|nr:glycosyltransferase [Salidesulfovibrio onnuriiensis]